MRTLQEIERMIINAHECDDGHYYDRSECHYCGMIDGIEIALMWVIGATDLYKEPNTDGGKDLLRSHLTTDTVGQFYRSYFDRQER